VDRAIGCLNFHAKRDGSLKLSLVIKNKWSVGSIKLCFFVMCHASGAPDVAKACMPSIRG
jgi:hypothetical protein